MKTTILIVLDGTPLLPELTRAGHKAKIAERIVRSPSEGPMDTEELITVEKEEEAASGLERSNRSCLDAS